MGIGYKEIEVFEKKNSLIIFARFPVRGKVKTRIAEKTGPGPSLSLYTALLTDLFKNIDHSKNNTSIFIEGDGDAKRFLKMFGLSLPVKKQQGKDLGEKMKNAFLNGFGRGMKKIIIVGSDIPGIYNDLIRKAFDRLNNNRLVIGPAEDGGYYLIGFTKEGFKGELFEKTEWGTSKVLQSTIDKAEQLGVTPCLLKQRRDLDTPEDLLFFRKHPDKLKGWDNTLKIINSLISGM